MDDNLIGLVIFVTISVATAVVAHWRFKNYWPATFLSTLLSVVLFQVVVYIELGYLDPFFLIAIVTSGAAAFVISVLVGTLIKSYRNKISSV